MIVVTGGFLTAGYLINSSFSAWKEAPIATSIETYPISKAVYPRVSVCPPVGTNTALNHDLVEAKNSTLDNETREELTKLVNKCLHDEKYKEIYDERTAFEEKSKYRK